MKWTVKCSIGSDDGGLYVELVTGGFARLGGGVEVRVHEERVAGRLLSADDLPVVLQLVVEREPLVLCFWWAPRLEHRTRQWDWCEIDGIELIMPPPLCSALPNALKHTWKIRFIDTQILTKV